MHTGRENHDVICSVTLSKSGRFKRLVYLAIYPLYCVHCTDECTQNTIQLYIFRGFSTQFIQCKDVHAFNTIQIRFLLKTRNSNIFLMRNSLQYDYLKLQNNLKIK